MRWFFVFLLMAAATQSNAATSSGTSSGAATDLYVDNELDEYEPAPRRNVADAPSVRRFHEVLEELLVEFGHDIKTGQVQSLKNLSIRRTMVSDTLPRSYGNYVELLVAERFRENSRIKLISCLPCKSKSSRIINQKLVITSPHTNVEEMARAADRLGIDYFMDVILVYHTTHMVLAFQIFNTETKEMVWARTYNSETIRSRFQKLAVDYKQVVKSRVSDEYVPEWRYLVGFGGGSIPNVVAGARESSMLTLHVRGTEKFNNRRSEFGLLTSLNISTSSILSEYPTTTTSATTETTEETTEETPETELQPFTTALGLYAIYGHNFFGQVENFDRIRFGLTSALGLHLAAGYIAPALRVGTDMFLGKKFLISFSGLFVGGANILVDGKFVRIDGGGGGDVTISYSF